jgi:Flp pilus assembly protein protease CpaA
MLDTNMILDILLIVFLVYIVISDITKREVPQVAIIALLLGGITKAYFSEELLVRILACIAVFLLLVVMYTFIGGIGGGDIKLISVLILWEGLLDTCVLMLIAYAVGIVVWILYFGIKAKVLKDNDGIINMKNIQYSLFVLFFFGIGGVIRKAQSERMTDEEIEKNKFNMIPYGAILSAVVIIDTILKGYTG